MHISRSEIVELFNNFSQQKVLILGDVMIDSYLWGKVDRISPEAPVPVVSVKKRNSLLGGAANVALNIKALGATPLLCSAIGADQRGAEFKALLTQAGISSEGIVESPSRITTTKFRIIGNNAQMLRVDEEMDAELNTDDETVLMHRLDDLFRQHTISVVILQDYNKGVLTPAVIEKICTIARLAGAPVVVDPKRKNFELYNHVDLFKPNLKELRDGLKLDADLDSVEIIREAVKQWQDRQSIKAMMVTLSEAGVYIRETKNKNETVEEYHLPAHLRKIADVSGAGDTVISVASLCRALRVSAYLTASVSNLAGGLVCEHVGVVPVDRNLLLSEALVHLVKE